MTNFKMTLTVTGNKAAKNFYQVFDENGNKIGDRRTNRTYVAAYVFFSEEYVSPQYNEAGHLLAHDKHGNWIVYETRRNGKLHVNFWFGRMDLVGKGDSKKCRAEDIAGLAVLETK